MLKKSIYGQTQGNVIGILCRVLENFNRSGLSYPHSLVNMSEEHRSDWFSYSHLKTSKRVLMNA